MAGAVGAVLAVTGGVLGSLVVAGLVAGCVGDDTAPMDSGADQSAESGPDGTTQPDAVGDTTKGDTATGDANEVGSDGAMGDADATVDSADAASDADATVNGNDDAADGDSSVVTDGDASAPQDADGGDGSDGEVTDALDGGDGGDAEDASDANSIPPTLLGYPQQYVTALCAGWANCCGSGFNQPMCQGDWLAGGWDNTLLSTDVYDGGNLTFDARQAARCLAALQAWPCGTWNAAANQAILDACTGVLGGTIPVGSTGCISPFECVSGAFCNGGTCTALTASGGTCARDWECSYVGTKQPAAYCNVYPSDGGTPATGTCASPQADGTSSFCANANLFSDFACANRLCGDNGTCASTAANPATNACGAYGGD
jgi:hypothetical protein